ncbi:MAG: beta-RFAP synthase [Gemmataceae bacterium]
MIRATAPSRLHFGLFNPGADEPWPNLDGAPAVPGRRFGGVGLMLCDPGLQVAAEPAAEWAAAGPLAGRALEFARRFAATVPDLPPHRLVVERAAPEHVGLGTGTQLGLAVAQALAVAAGHADWGPVELARRVGRGERSAIGLHGFAGGGFLVDGGKRGDGAGPLLLRERFPDDWRVVLVLPAAGSGLHGAAERRAFERLLGAPRPGLAEVLCRLTLLGMLPALREGDCRAFGEALYDFNARVGEAFAVAQGGRYAGPLAAAVVQEVRRLGLAGAGQSSWGPAAFAVAESESRAAEVAARLQDHFGGVVMVSVTAAFNGR